MGTKRHAKHRQQEAEDRRQRPVKAAKVNPFELRQQRRKYDVLGQQIKGETGHRTQSRDAAIKTREKTLLVEYKARHKDQQFKDNRFGEHNPSLSVEEKMLARFAREQRKKHSRSSVFNLDDDDEEADELLLTHNAKPLSEAMDHALVSDNEDEEDGDEPGRDRFAGAVSADMVAQYHFGGGARQNASSLTEDRPRSHKEIMAEVVSKAKMHKANRQMQQQANEELTAQVDAQLNSVLGLLMTESARAEKEGRVLAAPADSAYDVAVHDLAKDVKARASDRLKTPQEEAEAERERLEQLEEERLRRMQGSKLQLSEEQAMASAEYLGEAVKSAHPRRKAAALELKLRADGRGKLIHHGEAARGDKRSASSVDDNGKASSIDDGEDEEEDDDNEDEDEDEEDGEEEEEEGEGSQGLGGDSGEGDEAELQPGLEFDEDDDDHGHDEGSEGEGSDAFGLEPDLTRGGDHTVAKHSASTEDFDVPFLFPALRDLQALVDVLAGFSPQQRATALARLVACHNVHLRAENRAIQERHFDLLLAYLHHIVQHNGGEELTPLTDALAGPLFRLVQQVPAHAATACRKAIVDMQEQLKGTSWPSFPRLRQLVLFQIVSAFLMVKIPQVVAEVFPTSDHWHVVATPATLVACHLLTHCSVANLRNMMAGLYLVSCLYHYVHQSRRYVPEAVAFLCGIATLLAHDPSKPNVCPPAGLLPAFRILHQQNPGATRLTGGAELQRMEPRRLSMTAVERGVQGESLPQLKLDLALATFGLLLKFVKLYRAHSATLEAVAGAESAAAVLVLRPVPPALKDTLARFQTALADARQPRAMARFQAHKPVPLPLLQPDFNEGGFFAKGSRDPDIRETQKLRYQLKKERKGAIRELRKDSRFLSKVRLQDVLENDADRNKKLNRAMNLIQSEASGKKPGRK